MSDIARAGDLTHKSGPVDLRAAIEVIWRHRRTFFGVIAATLALGILYLHSVDYRYTVVLQVTPVSNEDKGTTSRLGQIASAAGIDIETSGIETRVDNFELFLQGIYTRDTASALAEDQPLMHEVFAKDWDEHAKRWRDPNPLLTSATNAVDSMFGLPATGWKPPDAARVQDFIIRNVQIERDIKNPVVTLQMISANPEMAEQFLTRLHAVDDGLLRQRALARTSKYIDYLNSEMKKVTFEEYRQALLQLLSDQEKHRMFANSAAITYAAEPFQTATFDPSPSQPRPILVLFVCLILGTMLGTFAAYFADQWRQEPQGAR